MLPIYVMGFINLRKIIKNFCEKMMGNRWEPRANLYLADSLKYNEKNCPALAMNPVNVIFCNPPYSRHSLNKGEWITLLVKDYMRINNRRIKEKNLKGLHDDYVKFFRLAQWKIDQTGSGIMAFITNNSYLENPTFRGMRYSLLNSFDEIYILNLHGTAGKVKKKDDDDDENIFDIGQGIAIGFFIKRKKTDPVKENLYSLKCKVYYSGIKGSKVSKLKILRELKESNYKAVQWQRVFPGEEFYLFTPVEKVDIYRHFIKVTDIFPLHGVGIVTARDKLTIKESEQAVHETISFFSQLEEKKARKIYRLGKDTRDWQVTAAQKDIKDSFLDRSKMVPILYQPFDIRYTYYTGKSRGFLCMPRSELMRHMLTDNIGLVTVRQVPGGVFNHCFVTDTIINASITNTQKGMAYIFPLYKYIFSDENKKTREFNYNKVYPVQGQTSQCNIAPPVFTRLRELFGKDNLPSSGEIFYYIYAVLSSGIYRERYRDYLKVDFPRIPFTSDLELFKKLSRLGKGLAGVHLLKSGELDQTFSKFEVIGENVVKTPQFKPTTGGDGRVYTDETQYFSNISKELWEYEICGYQVLHKWLNDRKNSVLSTLDILHYTRICRALQLTVKFQQEIDGFYSQLEKSL
jgi:predicted helicase